MKSGIKVDFDGDYFCIKWTVLAKLVISDNPKYKDLVQQAGSRLKMALHPKTSARPFSEIDHNSPLLVSERANALSNDI